MPNLTRNRAPLAVPAVPTRELAQLSLQDKYGDRLQQMGQGGMPLYRELPDPAEDLLITVHVSNPRADGSTTKYLSQGTNQCAIGKGLWDDIQEENEGEEFTMTLVVQEPIPYTEDELRGFMPGAENRDGVLASYRQLLAKKGLRYCAISHVD